MENELIALKASENFPVDSKMNLVFTSPIVKVKLSPNENYLAVAIAPQ